MNKRKGSKMSFRHKTDLVQMYDDIVKATEIAEVPYKKDVIWSVLNAYRDFFSGSSVTFTTSTKPKDKRVLSVRYVELQVPHDAYSIAIEKGLMTKLDHPIFNFYLEIQPRYPMLGYGVDMEVSYGLTKIWTFFQIPQPIEEAYAMSSLPDSIKSHANYFSKYGLIDFSLFALDFRQKTTNVYFMVDKPGKFPPEKIARMIGDLDFEVPRQEILGYCSEALTIYPTFSWSSDRMERLCFGMVAPNSSSVPTHLHPLIENYVEQAPILSEKRMFIYSITPSRSGDYIKIENDYTGSMIDQMTLGSQAPMMLEELKRRRSEDVQRVTETSKEMEWEPEVYELFEKIVAQVPEVFRAMVRPMLHETADKKCQERNANYVNEADIITALFDITPEPFKAESVENLKAFP
ncbi:hypothetical protein KA005_12315, partial [bacterium]|nr:hypothetical protein [bacterium]